MKVLMLIVILVGSLFSLRFLYLTQIEKRANQEALTLIRSEIQKCVNSIKIHYNVYVLRQTIFNIYVHTLEPYEKVVRQLGICKYFRFMLLVEKNIDLVELHFTILGISKEYLDDLQELAFLLGRLLQDFFIERFGCIQYPLVHVSLIEEKKVVFEVAKNAYGNLLIQERVSADEYRNIPNMEDLTDD